MKRKHVNSKYSSRALLSNEPLWSLRRPLPHPHRQQPRLLRSDQGAANPDRLRPEADFGIADISLFDLRGQK